MKHVQGRVIINTQSGIISIKAISITSTIIFTFFKFAFTAYFGWQMKR